MKYHLVAASLWVLAASAQAGSPASIYCPPIGFVTGNTAVNGSFETAQPGVPAGTETCWTPRTGSTDSAAASWTMHSSNGGAKVCSTLVPSNAPGANGNLMLKFRAGGNEGGVFQSIPGTAGKTYMFSAWVKVAKGQVAMQSSGGNTGPVSWSTKHGEWEQLRVCTDSTGATDTMVIYNQDPNGGLFYVDRVELRETVPGP
ncbi:MAG TPA: hypothetical protein VFY73_04300 [Ideonella sp.]|uniref:hypothetical protein n=1 Tax=Ideonella sp. TaxID=1929293 RepID=UPI002E325ED9|nr:hypothetical protein [Ideonella sp.]HEX5683237.1 hypothetical protein [Ideonella sp.]